MSLWLTRPQEDSEAMASALALQGIATIIAPVLQIRTLPFTLPARPDALVLTSRHAATAVPAAWRDLPCYAVGQATAQAAQAAGCTQLTTGQGSALDLLLPIAAQEKPGARLLHLSGAEIKIDLAPLLAARGILLERCVVYEAQPCPLPPALREALRAERITGVVFYSPQSARVAFESLGEDAHALRRADGYCLSLDVAAAAAALPFKRLLSCPVPTHQAMMELLSQAAINTA